MCTWGDWEPENSQMKLTINYKNYIYQKTVICLLTWDEFKKFTPVSISKHCLIPLFSDAKYCSDLEGQIYPNVNINILNEVQSELL